MSEERARKVLADVLKLNEAQRVSFNDGNLIPIIFPSDAVTAMLAFAAEARSHDGSREDALAEALCLLDTFAGEGLCHVYGNGQTLDATDTCTQLAAAIGVECEPGWWRTVAAMVSAVPLFDEGRETG